MKKIILELEEKEVELIYYILDFCNKISFEILIADVDHNDIFSTLLKKLKEKKKWRKRKLEIKQ